MAPWILSHPRLLMARRLAILVLACVCSGVTPAGEAPAPDRRPPDAPLVVIGTQPLGYPSGVVSAVMGRDRILRRALAADGQALRMTPFRGGADMVALLADGRLDAGLLGDMPTLGAATAAAADAAGLAALRAALAAHKPRPARCLFAELAPGLTRTYGAPTVQTMAAAMDKLAFDEALRILDGAANEERRPAVAP